MSDKKGGGYGPTITDGKINYFSATSLSCGDPNQDGGCLRRYWFKYVAKKKEPQTAAQTKGYEELHKPIEQYYIHGTRSFPRFVLAGTHFLPARSDRVLPEVEIKDFELKVCGVPVIGKIDLLNATGSWIDPDGNHKELNGVEVIDWKSTGNLQWAKSGPDLLKTIQMPLYAAAVKDIKENADGVRLSHVYFSTGKHDAKKSSIVADFDTIARKKTEIESVAKNIIDIVGETDSNKVEANARACNAYGGCPHREYCGAGNRSGIERLFGKDMTALLKPKTTVEPNILEKMKALKEVEEKQKQALALKKAFETIELDPRGMPQLSGDAAKAWANYKNMEFSGQGFAGSGELGELNVTDTETIIKLAEELNNTPTEPVVAGLVPDNVPEPIAPVVAEIVVSPEAVKIIDEAPEEPPKKRGRKAKKDEDVVGTIAVPVTVGKITIPWDGKVPAEHSEGYNVYVDCVPLTSTVSLDPYIDDLCRTLCNKFECADIRVAPKDGPLAFGGWRGVVRAYVLASPPPPGDYTLFSGMREITVEVADALREYCQRNGGNFVKGVGR
jgi:hypothetical protein